jgi:fibronectin-binding autotransporter adhesin
MLAIGQIPAATINWLTNGTTDWNTATNWSSNTVPTSVDTAIIGAGGNQPLINMPNVVQNLTLSASGSSLGIQAGESLGINTGTMAGISTISNAGNINLAANSSLFMQGGGTVNLTGAGTVNLTSGQVASLTANAVLNNSSTIQGSGVIGGNGTQIFSLNNSGTISANVSGGKLAIIDGEAPFTNTGTMQAANGGIFNMTAFINNAGGLIKSDGVGSVVNLAGFAINGGTLTASNGGVIQTNMNGTFSGSMSGAVTLNGTLTVNDFAGFTTQALNGTPGSLTLNGSGTVSLAGANSFLYYSAAGDVATLTNNTTIAGQGSMGAGTLAANFTNNGTINANVNVGTLTFQNGGVPITNTGTMEATNGGILHSLVSVNNTGGLILADGMGSVVKLDSGSSGQPVITDGTIKSTNGGVVDVIGKGMTFAGNMTLNGVEVFGIGATGLNLQAGATINNQGILSVTANTVDSTLQLYSPSAGGGTVTLNGSSGELILGRNGAGTDHITANQAGMTLVNNSVIEGTGAFDASGGALLTLVNNGTVEASSSGPLTISAASITNNGDLQSNAGDALTVQTNVLTNYNAATHTLTGGTYEAFEANFTGSTGFSIVNNEASLVQIGNAIFQDQGGTNALSNFVVNGSLGSFLLDDGSFTTTSGFSNAGIVEIGGFGKFTAGPVYTNTAGTTQVDGTLTDGTVVVQGGTLQGQGTVQGAVQNFFGVVAPENLGPTTLTVTNTFTQGPGGTVMIGIDGLLDYSLLQVDGTAGLNGTLDVVLNGYTGNLGDVFTIVKSAGLGGSNFSNLILPGLAGGLEFKESTDANNVYLTVVPSPEPSSVVLMMAGLAMVLWIRRRTTKA